MMKCVLGLLIISLFAAPAHAKSGGPCARKFFSSGDQTDTTIDFIIYLEMLLDSREINIGELELFRTSLGKNKIINPIAHKDLNKHHAFHYDEFQKLIDHSVLDPARIASWLSDYEIKHQILVTQKVTTEQKTMAKPVYISPAGAMFYLFEHPGLGEVYRILKPGGRYSHEQDWEEKVWALEPLKDNANELIILGESDLQKLRDSKAYKACLERGYGSSLPNKEDYKHLISHFESEYIGDLIRLTRVGHSVFNQLFPKSGTHRFWTSSFLRNSDGVWIYNGISGTLIYNNRNGLPRPVRCIGRWRDRNLP